MKKIKEYDGKIIQTNGPKLEVGEEVKIIFVNKENDYDESIVFIGSNGFRAYPSEDLFLKLFEYSDHGKSNPVIRGTIVGIIDEGTYSIHINLV